MKKRVYLYPGIFESGGVSCKFFDIVVYDRSFSNGEKTDLKVIPPGALDRV